MNHVDGELFVARPVDAHVDVASDVVRLAIPLIVGAQRSTPFVTCRGLALGRGSASVSDSALGSVSESVSALKSAAASPWGLVAAKPGGLGTAARTDLRARAASSRPFARLLMRTRCVLQSAWRISRARPSRGAGSSSRRLSRQRSAMPAMYRTARPNVAVGTTAVRTTRRGDGHPAAAVGPAVQAIGLVRRSDADHARVCRREGSMRLTRRCRPQRRRRRPCEWRRRRRRASTLVGSCPAMLMLITSAPCSVAQTTPAAMFDCVPWPCPLRTLTGMILQRQQHAGDAYAVVARQRAAVVATAVPWPSSSYGFVSLLWKSQP